MAKGKRFVNSRGNLASLLPGGQSQTQGQQQTGASNTSGQQSSGGIFLPGITDNAQLKANNEIERSNRYLESIEEGRISSNVVLPGINDKSRFVSNMDATTLEQKLRANVRAENNNVDRKSSYEKIQDELNSPYKVLGQLDNVIGTYVKTPINNYKKFLTRAIWDSGLTQNFVKKKLKKEGINLSDDTMDSISKVGEKIIVAYTDEINNNFKKLEEKNLNPRFKEKYDNENISDLIGKGDFAGALYKMTKGTAENWQMIPEMGLTIALPPVGLTVMGMDVYVQENQGTFEDMMNNGASYEEARNGAIIVGILNSGIELLMERFLGGVQRAGATAFRRLFLKETQREIVRNATKKGFAEIIGRGLSGIVKGSLVEGFEEVLQQIVGNVMVSLFNPNRKWSEGTRESFEGGFFNLFNVFGGAGPVIEDYQNNKKVDLQTDIEALNYVMEGEERKAQRMQQAKERMKQRFLENRKGAETWNEVEERDNNFVQESETEISNSEDAVEQRMIEEVTNRGGSDIEISDESYQRTEKASPESPTEINKDLQDIKDSIDNMDDNTFFNRIMSSINKGNKNYVVTTDNNGNKSVLRVVERGGNTKGSNGKTITVQVMKPSKKSGNVSVSEFTYTPGNLTIDQKQGIITGFENWGKTGNFSDNTAGNERYQLKYEEKLYNPGVADKNEKSISGKEGVQQRNKINDETIEQLANKYGVRVDVIKGLIKVLKDGKWNGKDYAYGKYLDQVLTLSEQIKESTAPHELLHAIFDMIDPETKAYLISQVMKSEGWSAKQAEEWLADSFSNFFRTGKIESAPKSTWGKIKIFFKRVRSFINGLGRWRSELEEIFTDIITAEDIEDLQGRIDRSEKLNEAKARMKKRFMEYAKNAEKVQKKAKKSEAKYQEAKDIRDLTLNNEKKEGAYDPRASLPKVRGGWTKAKIEKQIKEGGATVGISGALRAIQEFDSPEDFRAHTFYHGTQGSFVAKPSMSIPEKTFDRIADNFGGGYGQRYWAISLTTDKRIASHFGGASDHVNIYPVILRKNATVIEMPELEDSADLDDYIEKLWNDGVDAVWIGDKNSGEKELAVLNPKAIVDLGASDYYRQYRLGSEDNPLRIKSDADFDRIYNNAGKYIEELRTLERKYIGIKNKYFLDNFGSDPFKLTDDWDKYKEAKKQWESSKEKEEYDKYKSEYNKRKWEIGDDIRYQTVDGSEREVKAEVIQAPVKGKMYHVTTEDFENFRESDEYDSEGAMDWNDAFGTYVTDSKVFLDDFMKVKGEYTPGQRKEIQIDVDIKKPVLHPRGTWKVFGVEKTDEMIIDYLKLVDRFDSDIQRELVALKMNDYDFENFNYDEYDFKDNYTKEEIMSMPGSISNSILDAIFQSERLEVNSMLFGDYVEEDRETLKKKGYDALMFYEGDKDGSDIFSYALFYPNRYTKKNLGIKYQEVDDIDPNIQSPNQMTIKRGRLSVIDKFISEKQKEKALDVSKELLVNEGRFEGLPYMWIHTNKYNSGIIPNFDNVKDSRYKEFTDLGKIVAFFTNNEDMSKSYADQKSVLANTKRFKNIEEFNKMFRDDSNRHKSEISGDPIKIEDYTKIVKDGDEYVIHKIFEDLHKYDSIDDMYKKFMPRDQKEGLSDSEKIKEVKQFAKDAFIGEDLDLYDGVEIIKDNGDVILRLWSDKELGRYKSEKGALANARSLVNKEGYYHYKGIIQNVHNPLVIDEKIYGNTTPNWNRLGTAYDVLMKSPKAKRGLNKIKKKLAELERGYNEIYSDLSKSYEAKKKLQEERSEAVSKMEAEKQETVDYAFDLREKITANTNGRKKIQNFFKNGGELEKLTPEEANSNIGDGETMQDVWNKAKKMYDDNKEFFEAIKRPDNALSDGWHTSQQVEGFQNYLIKLGGFDAGDTSLFHNVYLNTYGDFFWKLDIDKELKLKFMTTNDWVFYALKKGGYDGVLFKNIIDYGGKSIEGNVGGDVIAVFNPNNFKSWDNADPTDSKYISYQKMDSDEKNSDGKKLSNGQAEYFKDSKVRDENGNLLVVYHGTQAGNFTVYMHGKNGISNSLAKVGYRFTPNKQGALNFAKESLRGRSKPRADKVYLNITNPKIYEPRKIDLMSEEEKKVELDKEWDIYKEKKQKADAIDYTKAYGFFHDEYDHPIEERHLFATLSSQYEYAEKYNGKLGKYDPESMRWYSDKYGLDHDKIVKDVEEYERLKKEADEEYNKYLEMKISDPYDDFMYDIYKIDSNMDTKWTRKDLSMALNNYESPNKFREKLISEGYDGIIIKQTAYDGSVIGGGARNDQYVAFYSNQIKRTTNLNPTDNEDIRYQTVYHGSPNEFDRFDSSHMGEGEGAQAHGWGHYVAVDPKTARTYAEEPFRANEVEIDGKTVTRDEDLWDIPYALRTFYRDVFSTFSLGYYDIQEEGQQVIDRLIKEYEDTVEYYKKLIDDKTLPVGVEDVNLEKLQEDRKRYLKEFEEALEFIRDINPEDIQVRPIKDRRNFYEVEIPDPVKANTPTGSNYIEEQKKITLKQRKDLIKRLRNIKKDDDHFQAGVNFLENKLYAGQFKADDTWKNVYEYFDEGLLYRPREVSEALQAIGYDGIHYDGQRDGECYVIFDDNDLEIKNHEKYQIAEYDYDENGKRTNLKFGEDNGERDPSIFGEPTRKDIIEQDKENEKNNSFYDAWRFYNDQNFEDDWLTFNEFIEGILKWGEKQQAEYDQKMVDLSQAQNDPKMLELQLRAVKLMEEEGNVGKKFGKNVSKEVRERQQAEVEKKREDLIKDIFDWMYPGLSFEDATYDDQMRADEIEAEWEMMGREGIEEKLKYFKKDKNGNWEAKNIKIESPEEKWNKLVKSNNFDEVFTPVDRVLEWSTPQGQKGRIDRAKDPKKYKSVLEKINRGTTKTKVTLKDVTQEVRALEKYRAEQEAEKERKKKEKQEAMAKKKQEDYKRMVRMKAFQRLVDMQRFEKYPFLTEDEIKTRYGFTDDEWKTITEQEEIKLPKKWSERAVSDFNKAVDSQVKALIEGLNWQNTMKRKDAEKNLGEIGDIDIDVLLGMDEEKGAKEVEEFEKLAEEKDEDRTNKRLKDARDNIVDVEIDTERENSKSEREKIDKLIKSTKSDKTVWGSIKEFTSNILTPVSTKIKDISPKVYREVMRYFQNKDIKTNERLKTADPFLKAMRKIRKENPVRFMDIWVNLANRNIGYANGLLKEYGVTVPTELLDTIYDEAQDVGLNINYLGNYFPLSVKAPRKFLEELMKVNEKDIASEIEKKIMEESQKKGGPLEEAEITAIINDVIAGEDKGPDVNIGNAHLKKRNTEIKRTAKMLEYCDDPISTLISYIEGMTQSIERAKFLGKSRSGNVHTLADYVYNAKNGLNPEQQDELMDLLKAVFNDANPSKAIQTWRDLATLTTLGSPSSTLTQLGDLSFSVYENGWRETLKAVWDVFMKRKAFDLIDMGVLNRGEEYANINSRKNLLQKAIHNVFKLTFFSNFDTFGKSTFIQSTWNKWTRLARKDDKQLRKDIMKWTDDDYMTDKIINDLKNNNFSEDVALVMYMKLGNIQPLTRAQMPKAYLNNPNGRLFYQFKTFGIKQLDYVLQETKNQTKNFKNLSTGEKLLRILQIANMVMIMTLLGVGADELKDLTMRRRSNSLILRWLFGDGVGSEQVWEKIEDNVLKLFGLSRYTVMQMKRDPVEAITSLFTTLPATNIVNYPFKDIYKAIKDDGSIDRRNPSAYQLIPIIGKYRYWIYGGGQDKQQESLGKKKKKSGSGSGPRSRA